MNAPVVAMLAMSRRRDIVSGKISLLSSAMPHLEASALHLLLSAADGPVPVDLLAATNLWRPSALLAAIEDARRAELLDLDASREHLHWRGERDAVIARGSHADLTALLASPPCIELLLRGARRAAREHRFPSAEGLYRALAQIDPAARATFPGGEATWVAVVLEATRLFRSASPIDPAALEAATAFAEGHGDLATQAVLLAASGVRALPADLEGARRLFERASEASEALDAPVVRAEVHTYIAVSLVLSGRPGEGIAAFEALLGDVQTDLLDSTSGLLLDLEGAVPASALSHLAHAYAVVGDHARAVDLMQRVLARGIELGNRALEAQGQVMLALIFMLAGDRERAALHAEAAAGWFTTIASPYSWVCALARAWARADGQPREAREILERALPAWRQTGRYWAGGSTALSLLETLERAGLAPLDGLSVESEVARQLTSPQPLLSGIAHRWSARRASSAHKAGEMLVRARSLLREAGGGPELRLALEDARRLAEREGEAAEAARLRAELETCRAPLLAGTDLLHLASAVLDLGRLAALSPQREGFWGEVAARLCRELGAERCAILLLDEAGVPSALAARGAPAWREAVVARVAREVPSGPAMEPALSPGLSGRAGQLALVPFDDGGGRRGVAALENRDTAARIGATDAALLALLGRQLGILLANAALWRELHQMRQRLEQENRYHREAGPAAPLGGGRIVGGSAAMREVLELVRRAAPSTTPVLVTGESGVGKELIAREVHLVSGRRDGPLIAVHVASLSPGLVASALFGHERGAFTGATEQAKGRFELAHGGTLFLDEVGELSADDQVRLLRVLQEGTFERVGGSRPLRSDFRLVAVTNRDLAAEVRAGRFREDLYFRLAAFPIRVPPLRERREEIPTLALFFMERVARKLGLAFEGISERDMERLTHHGWPGNVRELEHVIERAALLSDPPRLRIPPLDGAGLRTRAVPPTESPADEWVSLEESERRYVRRVLHHVHGRVSGPGGAADLLKLKPSTLQFWIGKLGLREELALAREARARGA